MAQTSPRPTSRRRRLLNACRWRSRSINLRGYVRAIEAVLDQRRRRP